MADKQPWEKLRDEYASEFFLGIEYSADFHGMTEEEFEETLYIEGDDWINDEDEHNLDRTEQERLFWRTKEGQVIKITEMEDSHLLNTIRFLERNAQMNKDKVELYLLQGAATVNGEQASYKLDEVARDICDMSLGDFLVESIYCYQTLISEANYRKLDILKSPVHPNGV